LLDLNLPKKDGREVLAEVKADALLREIPVIVLTTSDDEADVHRAYGLHANCYLTKPVEFDDFIRKIRSIEEFWLTFVRLPAYPRQAHA
jgi:two-component system response regulator